ncbi:MAG: NUDIX hydrolase [Fibrobacterales bacterium]
MSQSSGSISVGVGVLIIRNNQVLLGERKGAHGEGTWALPGGHLEFGETITECAAREVLEETGLVIENVGHAGFTTDIFSDIQKQYVTLFALAHNPTGEPETLEPNKCLGWHWFSWDSLPSPLFAPLESLIAQGYTPGTT